MQLQVAYFDGRMPKGLLEKNLKGISSRTHPFGGNMQQLSDEENTHLETYKVVLQLLNNEVALNWQRLNNSLIANSILIGAWAVILTQNSDKLQKGLLIGISLLGLILSIFGYLLPLQEMHIMATGYYG